MEFVEGVYQNVNGKVEKVGEIKYTIIEEGDNNLRFTNGKHEKTVPVCNSDEFVYQIRKTRINAMGGRNGLLKFMEKEPSFRTVIAHRVFDYMK